MRLLYVSPVRLPTEKAHGYQTIKMCEAFAERHEVLLLAPATRKTELPLKAEDIYAYYSVKKNFEIKRLSSFGPSFLGKISDPLRFLTRVASHSFMASIWILNHRHEIDVIYSRDIIVLYLLRTVNRFVKLPLVYESHHFSRSADLSTPETTSAIEVTSLRGKLAKRLNGLVVTTSQLQELYVRAGMEEARVMVAPNGVDLGHFDIQVTKDEARERLGLTSDIKIAAYIGAFHTMGMEKGIPETLASAKYLFGEFEDLFFYFVGGPMERARKYRDFLEAEGLPLDRFIFLEKQAIGDVPMWMKASDVLLMPLPKNTHYSFYASPLKLFEYMASKRPIVASRLPAIEAVLAHGKNALLVEPGNPKSIAENVSLLLNDPEACQSIAEQAFTDVENQTWTDRAIRISDFISSIS